VKTGVRVVSDSSAVCGPEWKTLDRIIVREAGCPRRVDQPDVDVVLDGPLDGGAGAVGTQLHVHQAGTVRLAHGAERLRGSACMLA